MRLTAKGEYGVRAMVHLAFHYRDGPVPLKAIAKVENISFQYLEQIFPDLRRHGLVNSVRGPKGGYMLARHPRDIRVGDILRALEGPINPVSCFSEERREERSCPGPEQCKTRFVWEILRDRINDVLDSITLEDLVRWEPSQNTVKDKGFKEV
ncbi:MAG: Rrf2 family transcriptional regulator [Firmicutes bacterium]|nr:Rrf2 family transcriptional regulator [Bacillota bacterium]